ncbi:MAG: tail fiber domain-containing protein [Verrucomicrobia bacterium]|nr:tail fiber domain-containing protein [Verrucomicrobiota bacterium]
MKQFLLTLGLFATLTASAQVPQIINYQGRITVGGTNYDATGLFKFALVNSAGTANYWANDGTASGQPATGVSLAVSKGLYSVLLGDTTVSGMTAAIGSTVFNNSDVRLRVWFSDGSGYQQLTPDQRIAAVGYALAAATVADGAVTSAKLASGAVTSGALAAGAVGNASLADGAVTAAKLGSASVTTTKLDPTGATSGQVLTYNGSTVAWATPSGGGTTYSAGTGLSLVGTTFSLASGGVAASHLVAGAVGTTALADAGVTTAKLGNSAVTSAKLGASSVGSSALDLTGLTTVLWKAGGNSGTTAGTHFLGTTDNIALELKANSVRALRIEPNTSSAPNLIGGAPVNSVSSGVVGATIGGGGASSFNGTAITNIVKAHFGVIGGGGANGINTGATNSVIAGGYLNVISNNAAFATVGGGIANGAGTNAATVAGGYYNLASGFESTVAGGEANLASGTASFIGGGVTNIASGFEAVVGGGELNDATGAITFVGGGYFNAASAYGAVVGGGYANGAVGTNSIVAGGEQNLASNSVSTVSGGYFNGATGQGATVPGGWANLASGSNSFAAGFVANAGHNGAFVWSDSSSTTQFDSSAANQFNVRAAGGARIFSTSSGASGAGVTLAASGSSWQSVSDRNVKKDFAPVDGRDVLRRLESVPVQKWRYNWEAADTTPHYGPMAQDFKAAFFPGRDDKSISTLEFDGVELAAIQGLHALVKEKDAKIIALEQRLADIEARLGKLVK